MNNLVLTALQFLRIPYIYGGKNPLIGLDCSGLVCEILHSAGLLPWDFQSNAQGIYDHFKEKAVDGEIAAGSLSFYGKSLTQIDHVGFLIDTHLMVEAGHGDPSLLTIDLAVKKGAYSRVRPFNYRKDLIKILRPKYSDFGIDT